MILRNVFAEMSKKDQLSSSKDGGVKGRAGSTIHPVQIHTSCICAIVAVVNPIGVQHRNQLKDILSAK